MTTQFYENLLLQRHRIIAGMDEAGRGPLAGPVVAACVVFKEQINPIAGVTDSKKLSEKDRNRLYEEIIENCAEFSIEVASPEEIDQINILKATILAMNKAYQKLRSKPEVTIIDGGINYPLNFKYQSIEKGDFKHYSIAAASILAKTIRDEIMMKYDKEYPHYGFAEHKGYGTEEHYKKLEKYGPCPIHRITFIQQLKLF